MPRAHLMHSDRIGKIHGFRFRESTSNSGRSNVENDRFTRSLCNGGDDDDDESVEPFVIVTSTTGDRTQL